MVNLNDRVELFLRNCAFKKRLQTFAVLNKTHFDLNYFLKDSVQLYKSQIELILSMHNIIKVSSKIVVEMQDQKTDKFELTILLN